MLKGFLPINKPKGITSYDVIRKIKRVFKEEGVELPKIGHTGTLDPFASGVLVLCLGREFTKQAEKIQGLKKEYIVEIKFGAVSDTYDSTGKITNLKLRKGITNRNYEQKITKDKDVILKSSPFYIKGRNNSDKALFVQQNEIYPKSNKMAGYSGSREIQKDRLSKVLVEFTGEIWQQPPAFSAKKVKGQRAYKLARKGEKVDLKKVKVEIYNIEILDFKYPDLKLEVTCSKGTYIRSLAHDIGQELGVGAYAQELTRTAVGSFRIDKALSLEGLDMPKIQTNLVTTY